MASTRKQPGADDYVIGEVVGHGLVGPVRIGRYLPTGRVVAIEEVPAALAADPRFAALLGSHGELAATVRDPSIAAVYDLLDDGGTLRVVGELAAGAPLDSIAQPGRTLPLPAALTIIDGILAGLEVAHRHGLVHGAISPATVSVAPDGRVRLTGFAVAAALAATAPQPRATRRTRRGGTPGPTRGDDLWATARLAAELLEPQPGRRAHVTRLSSGVGAVLERALTGDARRRYQTATSLRAALNAAAAGSLGPHWRVPQALARLAAERPPDMPLASAPPAPLTATAPRPSAPRALSRFLRPVPARLAMVAGAAVAGALVALAIVGAIGPGPPPTAPLTLNSDLAMQVSPASGSCSATFTFVATGTVHGQGSLVYRWERSDGSASENQTQGIGGAQGGYRLTERWPMQGSRTGTATMTLRILSPAPMQVSRSVSYRCP